MQRYVLDTNILLHYIRGKEKFERIEKDVSLLSGKALPLVSSVTVGEIYGFIQRQQWGKPKITNFHNLLQKMFIIDIMAKDKDLIQAYATIWNYSKNALPNHPLGRSIGIQQNDVWIAATARAAKAILITSDADFDHLHDTFITIMKMTAT